MHLYRTFREPKLYRYAKKFDYDRIIKRCHRHPAAAAREAKFRHDYPPQQTALHLLLEPLILLGFDQSIAEELREKRHEAAKALLEANKEAAHTTCTFGTTPVSMVAVDPYASLQDLDMLICASPKALLLPDIEGRLPLHYACINNRDNLEMSKMLLSSCSEAAFIEDKLKRLPLHYACMASASSSHPSSSGLDILANLLVDHSPKAPTSTTCVVQLLIAANRSAVSAVDASGMTPLHHLCHYIRGCQELPMELLAVLELLVKTSPSVLEQSDDSGYTPISMLEEVYQRGCKSGVNGDVTLRAALGTILMRSKDDAN